MDERIKLTGAVFSDLGRGAHFMALDWVRRLLEEKLGYAPYPATLNLRLESEEIDLWRNLREKLKGVDLPAPEQSYCSARCFLVEIEGRHPGAVLVPGVEGYPEDKIEVIAPVRLKDEMNLKDGDQVTVEFKV